MVINHDIHLHTHLSRCGKEDAYVNAYVAQAAELGLTLLGFTDHMWDDAFPGWPDFYDGQNFAHIDSLKEEIAQTEHPGVRILHGAEVEYDPARRDLAITPENVEKLDYIIVPNSHTHMVMPKEYYADKRKHIDFMLQAFMDVMDSPLARKITAMAHPFCAVDCPYGYEEMLGMISDSAYEKCFGAAADNGIAIEINLSKFRDYSIAQIQQSNNIRLFQIAKRTGCKFSFGSDAHTMRHQQQFKNFYVVAGILNLTEDDLCDFVRG